MKEVTKLRLQLLANGYTPLPNKFKQTLLGGWPALRVDEDAVKSWDRMVAYPSTGIRVDGDLAIIDVDVGIDGGAGLVADFRSRLAAELMPGYFNATSGVLTRTSTGAKRAWFLRAEGEPFARFVSREWMRPDDDPNDPELKTAKVEVYGSGKPRQFGAFGPHKADDTGNVVSTYGWKARSPKNTPLAALPTLPKEAFGKICDIFDAVAEAAGLVRVPAKAGDEDGGEGEAVYNLTEDVMFDTELGSMTLAELRAAAPAYDEGYLRCSGSFLGPGHVNKTRYSVKCDQHGLMIFDFESGTRFYEAGRQPPDPHEIGLEVQQRLAELKATAASPGDDGDGPASARRQARPMTSIEIVDGDSKKTMENAVDWLMAERALCDEAFGGRGGVVPINERGAPVTLAWLRTRMKRFSYVRGGSRGGTPKLINPVDVWINARGIVEVAGVRMRPDMPQPMFFENGHGFVNTYMPPEHPAEGGAVAGFMDWMERLVPDPDDRAWFLHWLAYKVKHPGARMVAVIMVAAESGTGRGLLCAVTARLFGREYVVPTTFAKLTGGPGSRFNGELAERLIVYVDESRDSDADRWSSNVAAYEALKVFVEPNGDIDQVIEGKGVNVTYRRLSVSTFIASNNLNVVKLPDSDRRFAIFANGRQATHAERAEFIRWMDNPANIGALWRHLKSMPAVSDPQIFDPYMAPKTRARGLVVEANKSESELAWEDAVGRISRVAGIYSMTQVIEIARRWPGAGAPGQASFRFDEQVKAHTRHHGHRIGVLQGKNWLVRHRGLKERVYTVDLAQRDHWTAASPREIKRELDKVQAIVESSNVAFTAGLSSISGSSSAASTDDEDEVG